MDHGRLPDLHIFYMSVVKPIVFSKFYKAQTNYYELVVYSRAE